jgi:hypothetical protein
MTLFNQRIFCRLKASAMAYRLLSKPSGKVGISISNRPTSANK